MESCNKIADSKMLTIVAASWPGVSQNVLVHFRSYIELHYALTCGPQR